MHCLLSPVVAAFLMAQNVQPQPAPPPPPGPPGGATPQYVGTHSKAGTTVSGKIQTGDVEVGAEDAAINNAGIGSAAAAKCTATANHLQYMSQLIEASIKMEAESTASTAVGNGVIDAKVSTNRATATWLKAPHVGYGAYLVSADAGASVYGPFPPNAPPRPQGTSAVGLQSYANNNAIQWRFRADWDAAHGDQPETSIGFAFAVNPTSKNVANMTADEFGTLKATLSAGACHFSWRGNSEVVSPYLRPNGKEIRTWELAWNDASGVARSAYLRWGPSYIYFDLDSQNLDQCWEKQTCQHILAATPGIEMAAYSGYWAHAWFSKSTSWGGPATVPLEATVTGHAKLQLTPTGNLPLPQ